MAYSNVIKLKEFEVRLSGSPPFQGGDDEKRCEARFSSGVVDDCDGFFAVKY